MGLIVQDSGPALQMLDTAEKTTISIFGDNIAGVRLFKNGEMKAQFGLRSDGWPVLTLSDKENSDRLFLGYDPTNDLCILQAEDKAGAQSAEMSVSAKYAIVDATDKAGNRRAGLTCMSASGTPNAFVADSNSNMVWQ